MHNIDQKSLLLKVVIWKMPYLKLSGQVIFFIVFRLLLHQQEQNAHSSSAAHSVAVWVHPLPLLTLHTHSIRSAPRLEKRNFEIFLSRKCTVRSSCPFTIWKYLRVLQNDRRTVELLLCVRRYFIFEIDFLAKYRPNHLLSLGREILKMPYLKFAGQLIFLVVRKRLIFH